MQKLKGTGKAKAGRKFHGPHDPKTITKGAGMKVPAPKKTPQFKGK